MKIFEKLHLLIIAAIFGTSIGAYRAFAVDLENPGMTYYLLIGAAILVFAVIAAVQGRKPAPTVREEYSTAFKTAIATASVLLFISSGFELYSLFSGTIDILLACTLALSIVSAFGMLYGVASKDPDMAGIMSVIPVFFMGMFLLQMYKQYAASCPNRNIFATEIIAIAFATLAVYAVCVMRYIGYSRSFLVSVSILGTVTLTLILAVSTLLTLPVGNIYVFDLPQLAVLVSVSIYCAAWYLNPPVKAEDDDGEEQDTSSDNEEPQVPDLNSIIEEVKSSEDDSEK